LRSNIERRRGVGGVMVGDSPEADVTGAESVGIPAILVGGTGAARCAAGLAEAGRLIGRDLDRAPQA